MMSKATSAIISAALIFQTGPQFPKKPTRCLAPSHSAFLCRSLLQSRSFDQGILICKCCLFLSSDRHTYLMDKDATLIVTKRRHSKLIMQFLPQKYLIRFQLQNYRKSETSTWSDYMPWITSLCSVNLPCDWLFKNWLQFLWTAVKSVDYIKLGCFVFSC